jgi:hypothetical protein
MLMRIGLLLLAYWLAAAPALPAQEVERARERLRGRLPDAVAAEVVAIVTDAATRGLPADAVADLALQGIARGRTADRVLAAVRDYVQLLSAGHAALEDAGRPEAAADIEAAALALASGAPAGAIRDVATAAPPDRALAIPLTVLGGLAAGGVPVEHAVEVLTGHLAQGADDATISALGAMALPERAPGLGRARDALAGAGSGIAIPVGALTLPVTTPLGVPGNIGLPGGRPLPPIGRPPLSLSGRD